MSHASSTTPTKGSNLPAALRAATAELVAERGPTGFSLREVARRAGVSHAAPAHHYGNSMGLLTAVAAEGFHTLLDSFDRATEGLDDPVERLCAMGKAYVNVAFEYPGHFGVMCNDELVDHDDPDLAVASIGAYQRLLEAMGDIRDALNPDLDVDTAATLTWSMVHGMAVLAPGFDDIATKTGTTTGPLDELVERCTALLVDGFAKR